MGLSTVVLVDYVVNCDGLPYVYKHIGPSNDHKMKLQT